jgi:hypothetical protein
VVEEKEEEARKESLRNEERIRLAKEESERFKEIAENRLKELL